MCFIDVLDETAKDALRTDNALSFTTWMLYFTEEGSSEDTRLGSVEDLEGRPDLLIPVWSRFVRWLSTKGDAVGLALNDRLWNDDQGWSDVQRTFADGSLGVVLQLSSTTMPGLYALVVDLDKARDIFRVWWPSRAGGLHGIVRSREHADDSGSNTVPVTVSARDLGRIAVLFEASALFEKMGLVVMTRGLTWPQIQKELHAVGLWSGRPLRDIQASGC
jgi:hypothetical protein